MAMQNGTLHHPAVKKLNFKSKMVDGHHCENQKIAISLPQFYRFWWNLAWWCILVLRTRYKVKVITFENLIWRIYTMLKTEKLLKCFLELHNDKFGNKTANINIKNCSLSIVLTTMDPKLQKLLEWWCYSALRRHSAGNITFLMIFTVFDPSLLTVWINGRF